MKPILIIIIGILLWQSADARQFTSNALQSASDFIEPKNGSDSLGKSYVKFWFYDGPERNNYRLAVNVSPDSILYGWGACKSYRTFDDEVLNNGKIPYTFFRPFNQGDTLNLYLSHIGRKEYLFWQSFGKADNNGGPFATPGTVSSNINGAIGSFTGFDDTTILLFIVIVAIAGLVAYKVCLLYTSDAADE